MVLLGYSDFVVQCTDLNHSYKKAPHQRGYILTEDLER